MSNPLIRHRPWRRGQPSWTPGFWERQYDRLLALLHIEIWCLNCSDLCATKRERKARLCVFCLDMREEDLRIRSPFDAERIGPDDPAWEIFQEALKGNAVRGTYDPRTGEVVSMTSQPPCQCTGTNAALGTTCPQCGGVRMTEEGS